MKPCELNGCTKAVYKLNVCLSLNVGINFNVGNNFTSQKSGFEFDKLYNFKKNMISAM